MMMSDLPIEGTSEDLWGVPDFEGPVHARPMPRWFSRSKTLVPLCRHWREPVDLLDGVVVFASAWFDRPMRGRIVDMDWPDVGFYLDGSWASAALVCSPGFRPPFARRPRGQIVVYPWPDLGLPQDPRRFKRALNGCSSRPPKGAGWRSAAPEATVGPAPRLPGCSCFRGSRHERRSAGFDAPTARRRSNRRSRRRRSGALPAEVRWPGPKRPGPAFAPIGCDVPPLRQNRAARSD